MRGPQEISPVGEPRSLAERRARLETRANAIRSRLLRTIDALDVRRHQVSEIGHHAKRLAVPLVAVVFGAAVLAVGATVAIRATVRRRRERRLGYRVSRMLAPPRLEKRPSLLQEAIRRVILTTLGILASALTKRGVTNVINGRTPYGRLAAGE